MLEKLDPDAARSLDERDLHAAGQGERPLEELCAELGQAVDLDHVLFKTARGDAGRTARGRSDGLASLGWHVGGINGLTGIPIRVQFLSCGNVLVGEGQPLVIMLT